VESSENVGRSDVLVSFVRSLTIFALLVEAAAVVFGGFILTMVGQMSYAVDGKSSSTLTAVIITAATLGLAGLAAGVVATLRLGRHPTRWPLPYMCAIAAIHLGIGAIGLISGYLVGIGALVVAGILTVTIWTLNPARFPFGSVGRNI
jgi:hypothetical protein